MWQRHRALILADEGRKMLCGLFGMQVVNHSREYQYPFPSPACGMVICEVAPRCSETSRLPA